LPDEDEQGFDLFSGGPGDMWPQPYADRWRDKSQTGERPSRIAADLLEALADGKVTP
jgi:hypothetical protein